MNYNLFEQISRLKGAIYSKHKAAFSGILIKALKPPGKLADKILKLFITPPKIDPGKLPLSVMIVSPPRAGSTIIYQVLTRIIPCVYISNLHEILPNYASHHYIKKNQFGIGLFDYNNYYGHTIAFNDVNEGNQFIDNIFAGISDKSKIRKRFTDLISTMQASNDKPFIFKNVRNYNNILRLHEAVPELIFLRIKRNPEQIIQSELKAHYELGTFHPIPDTLSNVPFDDPVDFTVRQILEIEREIEEQKKNILSSNWIEWEYETFCADSISMIQDFASNFLNIESNRLINNALREPLVASFRKKVNDDDEKRIKFLINKYSENSSTI